MKPSRAFITGEISWAYVALAFAWSGIGWWPFENAYLAYVLDRREWSWIWCVAMGVPGAALMIASLREHIAFRWPDPNPMRRWSMIQIDKSARLRGRLCLTLAFSWLYAFYVLTVVTKRPGAFLLIAVGGCAFMLAAWVENRRVQRDIRKQTSSFPAAAQN